MEPPIEHMICYPHVFPLVNVLSYHRQIGVSLKPMLHEYRRSDKICHPHRLAYDVVLGRTRIHRQTADVEVFILPRRKRGHLLDGPPTLFDFAT